MYFLTALAATICFVLLWLLAKSKKELHFEYGAIIFGAATAMWFIDCVVSAIGGEGFLSFEMPTDLYISIWTLSGGIVFYCAIVVSKLLIEKKKQNK